MDNEGIWPRVRHLKLEGHTSGIQAFTDPQHKHTYCFLQYKYVAWGYYREINILPTAESS